MTKTLLSPLWIVSYQEKWNLTEGTVRPPWHSCSENPKILLPQLSQNLYQGILFKAKALLLLNP
jgi:hypothetical protein